MRVRVRCWRPQEQEIALIGCVALAQRYMKTTTLDEFAQSLVLFAKTIVVAEMFFMDMRVMVWYIIAYFGASLRPAC